MARIRTKGEGTIFYSNAFKKWIGQFHNGYKENGKPNRKTIYGNSQKEVKEKMLKLQNLVLKDDYCDKSSVTFYDVAINIIETKYESNRISETSYGRLLGTLNKLKPIHNIEMQKISSVDLQKFLVSQVDLADSYIEKIYTFMNQVFKEAIKRKLINSNPMELTMKPKSKQAPVTQELAFTLEEEKLILDNLEKEKFRNVFMIAFHTGMRIGEILALTPSDIDLDKRLIKITKTLTKDKNGKPIVGTRAKTLNGIRTIPYIKELEPYLKDAIKNYEKNTHHLLFQENDSPIANSTINSQFKRICKNLNINVKPRLIVRPNKKIHSQTSNVHTHMIRHTYATRCIESGMPAVVLQRLLGHKDVSITLNTYTSVFNAFQEDSLNSYINYMNNK